jgi:hypothetical protein
MKIAEILRDSNYKINQIANEQDEESALKFINSLIQ